MSVWVRWEQCCESEDCKRPAHYGVLCAACFMAASPARRVVELETSRVDPRGAPWTPPVVQTMTDAPRIGEPDRGRLDPLEALWSLPAFAGGDA
jgi:hypothetical protein